MGSGSKPTSSVSDPMCSTHRALAYSYDAGQERLRTGPTSTGSDMSSCATKGLFGRSCAAELETEPTSSGSYLVVLPAVLWNELPMGIGETLSRRGGRVERTSVCDVGCCLVVYDMANNTSY